MVKRVMDKLMDQYYYFKITYLEPFQNCVILLSKRDLHELATHNCSFMGDKGKTILGYNYIITECFGDGNPKMSYYIEEVE